MGKFLCTASGRRQRDILERQMRKFPSKSLSEWFDKIKVFKNFFFAHISDTALLPEVFFSLEASAGISQNFSHLSLQLVKS